MKTYLPLCGFILLLVFCWRGLQLNPHNLPSVMLNQKVPAFKLPSLNEKNKMISQVIFKGHVTLVNVWASWCVACKEEHPVLMDIALSKTVPIVGMNYKDVPVNALQELAESGDPYTISIYDKSGDTAINWGVYGTPETFLVDKAGVIRFKVVGILTPSIWQNELLPRVKKLL